MTEEQTKFLYSIADNMGTTGIEDFTCKDGEKMREIIKALEQQPTTQEILSHIETGITATGQSDSYCVGFCNALIWLKACITHEEPQYFEDNKVSEISTGSTTTDDVMAIHTQGLDEGIRCAMCTNSMKSDKGCDGGCVVDNKMYKKVMETIKSQMFKQPTSDDCVDRNHVIATISHHHFDKDKDNFDLLVHNLCKEVKALPPVTPTQCIAAVRFSKDDLREICNERIELECTHGTCKDCKNMEKMNGKNFYCGSIDSVISNDDFYCAEFKKRGAENE